MSGSQTSKSVEFNRYVEARYIKIKLISTASQEGNIKNPTISVEVYGCYTPLGKVTENIP